MAELPRLLLDKYEPVEMLGEGGMGAVFKVRHRVLNQLFVIKTMRPQVEADDRLRARFVREAQTWASPSYGWSLAISSIMDAATLALTTSARWSQSCLNSSQPS